MNAHYCLLENEALLQIEGPDSLKFLQGQTTCDTRKIDALHSLPGAFCTPQGRMVCDFQLGQLGEEHFALRMRADILEQASATFGKYIIFSKAKLDTAQNDWQLIACWGDQVAQCLQEITECEIPTQQYGTTIGTGFTLVQLDEHAEQFELWLNTAENTALLTRLQSQLNEQTTDQWQALRIRAGIGRIEAATVETFLPQMLNYDLTGFVNFTKGCYTGQEIVARLHYRGKAKRRLYLTTLPAETTTPKAGTELFMDGSSSSVGHVVNAALESEQIVCLINSTEAGIAAGLHVGTETGPLLSLAELPYLINDEPSDTIEK